MGLLIMELFVKIIAGIICGILLTIVIIICSVKSLIDGICYGDWHVNNWKELPDLLHELCEHFKSPIFD